LVNGRLVTGHFVTGRYVTGRFVGVPFASDCLTLLVCSVHGEGARVLPGGGGAGQAPDVRHQRRPAQVPGPGEEEVPQRRVSRLHFYSIVNVDEVKRTET
jgi:hypothetical protein